MSANWNIVAAVVATGLLADMVYVLLLWWRRARTRIWWSLRIVGSSWLCISACWAGLLLAQPNRYASIHPFIWGILIGRAGATVGLWMLLTFVLREDRERSKPPGPASGSG